MKKIIRSLAIVGLLIMGRGPKDAANAGLNVNVNIGNEPPQFALAEQPEFISPPSLGFYVAVGIPYDMFYINSNYYLHRDNGWFMASSYNGPWVVVQQYNRLPRGLRRYKYDRIIAIRDEEYGNYQRDRDHYRGKHMGPKKHENQGERGDGGGQEQRGRGHGDQGHGNEGHGNQGHGDN